MTKCQWIVEVLRFIWTLPITLAGLVLMAAGEGPLWIRRVRGLVFYAVPRWWPIGRHYDAISLGSIVLFRGSKEVGHKMLVRHEEEHIHQAAILGPIMILLYPLMSLVAMVLYHEPYRLNYFEMCARHVSGEDRR